MTAPERDDEFEAFLKRRTLLPDRADRLEPPDHLNETVLNEARTAIRAEGRSVPAEVRPLRAERRPVRPARWARPVALAATILLCLSIVLNVTLNTNRPGAASAPAGGMADRPVMKDGGNVAASGYADSPAAEGTAVPEPEDARQLAAAGGTGSLDAQEAARSVAAPVPRARRDVVAQNSAPASPAAAASSRASGPAPAPAVAPAAAGVRARDEMRRELSASAADVQTRSEADAAKLAAPAQEPLAEQKPIEQPLAKRKAEAPGETEEQRKADAQPPHPQDPKVWLQQIETLRSHGKTAQADAEMQRFRAAFPDYPLEPRRPDPR